MDRIRALCINEKKTLKLIEISKDRFKYFKQFIIVERPVNADRIFVNTDVGVHTTEINIFAEIGQEYIYLYNISLFNLTDDEQSQILEYIALEIKANVIGIDCGDGMGRAIYNELEKTISKNNLVWYDGSMKIKVGFETDLDGNTKFDDKGNPVYKEEFMSEWSVKRLKDLFYAGQIILGEDYKFISQFTSVISMQSGTRTIYKCTCAQGDHLFDSFKVFAIAQWLKASFNDTPEIGESWGVGATN
jgi:hypothetical protein